MGAVFLLVLLPIVAALGFMLKTIQGEASAGGLFIAATFVFLAVVMSVGILRMAQEWDSGKTEP